MCNRVGCATRIYSYIQIKFLKNKTNKEEEEAHSLILSPSLVKTKGWRRVLLVGVVNIKCTRIWQIKCET